MTLDLGKPKPGAENCTCLCHKLPGVSHITACCNPNQEREFACCKRGVSKGHADDCELRCGTTHARPATVITPEDAVLSCCGQKVGDLPRGDVSSDDPGAVNCPGKNLPLAEDVVWAHPPFVYEGHNWTSLGEDGESAIMQGHVDPWLLALAQAAEYGTAATDYASGVQTWAVFTEHREDCREDLPPEDSCACDEYAWFARVDDGRTPGALLVTWWSA